MIVFHVTFFILCPKYLLSKSGNRHQQGEIKKMKIWSKPNVSETNAGMEVTSYASADIDVI